MRKAWEKTAKKAVRSNELYLVLFIGFLAFLFQAGNANFLTFENMFDVLKSISYMGLFAMAMFVVIISGGIDVSICPVAACAQYCMGLLMLRFPDAPPVLILLVPLLIGISLGMFNGLLIYLLKVPPMIVTISTMNLYFGILQIATSGQWLREFPGWFVNFGNWKVIHMVNANGAVYGLSGLTLLWFLFMAAVYFLMNRCAIGRRIFAMGGNEVAAQRSGINMFRMYLFIYGLSGCLAAMAGIIQAASAQFITTTSVFGLEMNVIAAIALGGASLTGGRGRIFGTILGIIIIEIIGNGLQLNRISSYWEMGIIGVIILVSIVITAVQQITMNRRAKG